MAVTRAKATSLLNATEMGLYDASRANALRGHSEAQLARLVIRARTARDRARDLEKRQKLALRKQTGSKTGRSGQANARSGEKAELLGDILQRLDAQHKETAKAARTERRTAGAANASKVSAKKPAAKKAPAKKAITKKATTKKAASKKATKKTTTTTSATPGSASKKAVAKNVPEKKAAAKKARAKNAVSTSATKRAASSKTAATKRPARKATASKTGDGTSATRQATKPAAPVSRVATTANARKAATGKTGGISPKKALANTRKLLDQHNAEARAPKPWQQIDEGGTSMPAPGYQSTQAAQKAQELHAAESRLASIQGSVSTRDRKNQGKRDHRNES